MGQNLDKNKIKAIVENELDDFVHDYNISVEDIEVSDDKTKVKVTFGLHIVPEDDYIGLASY